MHGTLCHQTSLSNNSSCTLSGGGTSKSTRSPSVHTSRAMNFGSVISTSSVPKTNNIESKSYSIIPCLCIQALTCFEHSNFFKVNVADPLHTQLRAHTVFARKNSVASNIPCGRPAEPSRNPTTSFLTATTLI